MHAVAIAAFASVATHAFADDTVPANTHYSLGQGYEVSGTGLRLGGYATASLNAPNDDTFRAAVDNLSLFLWWEGEGRWKFFSEFEYQNLVTSRADRLRSNHYLSWERAYIDYALTDSTTVRAGKFLTPIGRWNLIHATPLVWTTSRPLLTTEAFPTNMTGLMVSGSAPIGNGIDYSLYGSTGSELRPNPDLDPFSSALGAHVTVPIGENAQLGVSFADFEQEKTRPERKQLWGVDFLWSRNRFEISAEAVYRSSDIGSRYDEKGAYLQFVAPLAGKLYAVARVESFRSARDTASTRFVVGGLAYRILPSLVLKAEYVDAHHNTLEAPDGFLASISVLL